MSPQELSRSFLCSAALSIGAMLACVPASAATRYVDASAPAGGDGLTWATALNTLTPSILFPLSSGDEIRVAQGTYKPTFPGGPRAATFIVPCNGGVVRGGYAGRAGANPDARDPALYPTILSGDLNGNDLPGFVNVGENSFHVVSIGTGSGPAPTIEGVTITGGNANGTVGSFDSFGAGIIGPGVPVTLRDCRIVSNRATGAGAGIDIAHTGANVPTGGSLFERCRFENNVVTSAAGQGGAVYYTTTPVSEPLTVHFSRCEFVGNVAPNQGGAAWLYRVNATFFDCLIDSNDTTTGQGSAIAFGEGSHRVVNCTIVGNTSGGAATNGAIGPVVVASLMPVVRVTNSILWGNSPRQIGVSLDPTVTYSAVQGGAAGEGNIDADPMFTDFGAADYTLGAGSPCADAGDSPACLLVCAEVGVASDLAFRPRFFDDPGAADTGLGGVPVVDMGAYERVPVGAPDPCPSDTNGDGRIDFVDLNNILSIFGASCP